MARVKEVTPETAQGEVAEIFADSLRQFGRVSNFSKVMANAPAALKAWMIANRGVRMKYLKAGDFDFLRIEQMVIVRTASLNAGRYCLGHNVDLGLEAGLTREQVVAIQGDYESSPLFSDREKTAIRWAEAVTKLEAHDDDELFAEVQRRFTDEQIVELTVLIGMWNFSNRLTEALHVELEPEGERVNFFHPGSDVTSATAPTAVAR
jgi:alkylhydroperoxidase family enzyme